VKSEISKFLEVVMSFSFSFLTNSGDRAKALTAGFAPPEPVMAFVSAACDAIGVLPAGWVIQVSANGHLDAPAGASAASAGSTPPTTAPSDGTSAPPPTTAPPTPSMPAAMSQGCTISVTPLQIME
jgi:hypothetical protein